MTPRLLFCYIISVEAAIFVGALALAVLNVVRMLLIVTFSGETTPNAVKEPRRE